MRTILMALFMALTGSSLARAQLVLHEWGTFTSLQDETGRAIGGINTDDEPVPDFVHRAVSRNLIQSASAGSGKGAPPNDPDVTMRLETPVIYFHLPPGSKPQTIDLSVAFNGGWLTEYFPDADANDPGLTSTDSVGHLTSRTIGHLRWPAVRIGVAGDAPQTGDSVWTSPRNVQCDPIRVRSESEKFLFYRGVGHLDSPLNVARSPDGRLAIFDRYPLPSTPGAKSERPESPTQPFRSKPPGPPTTS